MPVRPDSPTKLKARRLKLGLTLQYVSTKLGITAPTLLRWERSESTPNPIMVDAWRRVIDQEEEADRQSA